jgi:hypothetical protein
VCVRACNKSYMDPATMLCGTFFLPLRLIWESKSLTMVENATAYSLILLYSWRSPAERSGEGLWGLVRAWERGGSRAFWSYPFGTFFYRIVAGSV